jgi:hypothetical protein
MVRPIRDVVVCVALLAVTNFDGEATIIAALAVETWYASSRLPHTFQTRQVSNL